MPGSSDEIISIDLPGMGTVPVRVIRESRRSLRASIGKDHLIFRRPRRTTLHQDRTHWQWFMDWARRTAKQQGGRQMAHLRARMYQNGQELIVGERTYRILMQEADRKTIGGKLLPARTIEIRLPENLPTILKEQGIRKILSRVIAQDFLPAIRQRVIVLNDTYFQQTIREVRLKYNHSNWGSCSNKGNINLSTRLLFAPGFVIDYVIIHELAHRIEFNHSPRFWRLVENAMPEYEKAEAWLKEHYHECDF